jgi:hypothetical protein
MISTIPARFVFDPSLGDDGASSVHVLCADDTNTAERLTLCGTWLMQDYRQWKTLDHAVNFTCYCEKCLKALLAMVEQQWRAMSQDMADIAAEDRRWRDLNELGYIRPEHEEWR